jgi:hypothetical protein
MEYISLGSNCSITYQLNKLSLRTHSYPFDWSKVSLSQLINVLSSNFIDYADSIKFKKESKLHSLINDDKYIVNNTSSIIFTNKYGIIFAHELVSKYKVEEFKNKIKTRIERFYNLSTNSNKIKFIRIEVNSIKSNWSDKIFQLISLLDKIVLSYELILVINSSIQFEFPPNIIIYKFNEFNPDWKMDNLDWLNLIN